MKRKMRLILTVLLAMCVPLAILAACGPHGEAKDPLKAGEEQGTYYMDADGKEYSLTLNEDCSFTMSLGAGPVEGHYVPNGEDITFTPADGASFAGNYFEDVLTVYYTQGTYKFLRRIEYTLTFDTHGGSGVEEVKVLNGRSAARPADPSKTGEVFVGWYNDDAFKSPYDFKEPVTSDFTLHARFVVPKDPEFTVTFDLGGAQCAPIPAAETVGNKLFALPEPAWTGHTFTGWWVSHANDREKLTYRYEEQALEEHTTLFAVWDDAPVLSIGDTEIVWAPVEGVAQYTLTIEDLATGDRETKTLSSPSYVHGFSEKPAGEYEIVLTAGSVTARGYYRNKALAKVSVFTVEGNTLFFNAVGNAERYLINVACATEGHDALHREIAAGMPLSFNFSECDLKDGGLVFTVTAEAEGLLSSEATYTVTRTLGRAEGMHVEAASELLRWTEVPNAVSYEVVVRKGTNELYRGSVAGTSFSLKTYDRGALTLSVTPKARGWNSPQAASLVYDKLTLATPSDVHADIASSSIVWKRVAGAAKYEVRVSGQDPVETDTNSIDFTENLYREGIADYDISVRALADNVPASLWSDIYSVRYGNLGGELRYADGALTWDPVFGVEKYFLTVNGGEETEYPNVPQIGVTFTESTSYTYSLVAQYENGQRSSPISCTVQVYRISFDAMGSEKRPSALYLARGDKIELPGEDDVSLFGYTFGGWYTMEEGGVLYDDSVFVDQRDRTLYAHWDPRIFHIEFDAGVYGEMTDELREGIDVAYRAGMQLPIPASNDPVKGFFGWYDAPTGGVRYTRANGVLESYTQGNDIKLYAKWGDVLAFTPVMRGGAIAEYTVSKSADLAFSGAPEIRIPATYKGKPVTEVVDFYDCPGLVTVYIPESIRLIGAAATENAFSGCTSLKNIFIYETDEVGGDRYYSDADGVLLYLDTRSRMLELRIYPEGRDEKNYTVPDGVQSLPAGVLYGDTGITSLTIPASVTEIGSRAIGSDTDLHATIETVVFTAAASGREQPLTVADGAFSCMADLKHLTLPSRILDLNFYRIFGSSFSPADLETLEFVGTGNYSLVDGAVYEDLGTQNGLKLIYYPAAESFTPAPHTTRIGDDAVRGNSKLTTVSIPAAIETIGARAFYGCSAVTSLTFATTGSALSSIGEYAFYDCGTSTQTALAISLPSSLQQVGAHAFGGMKDLTVTIEGTPTFAAGAFTADDGKSSVSTLKIGKGVESINFRSVLGGISSTTVEVDPENPHYESEGSLIYRKNAAGEKVELVWFSSLPSDYVMPDTIQTIGAETFKGQFLWSVTIPASVTEIGEGAFENCIAMDTVTFKGTHASLTIGARAFAGCSSLTKISLPEGTVSLGDEVFMGCSELETVELPASLKELAVKTDAQGLAQHKVESVDIFPDSVATLTVKEGNEHFAAQDNVLYALADGEKAEILFAARASSVTALSIPASVTKVWDYAFKNCKKLTSVTFADCTALTIGTEAFHNCTALSEVELPAGLTSIGRLAFFSNAIEEIVIPNTVTSIGAQAFNWCSSLKTVTFQAGGMSALRLEDEWSDPSVGIGIFANCGSLTEVELPERTSYIGAAAFRGCNFAELSIPASVAEIGDYAFSGGTIGAVRFAEGSTLTTIGDMAFERANLEKIELPASIMYIGSGAFYRSTLTSFTVEDGNALERVGSRTLGQLSILEQEHGVFEECTELREASFGANTKVAFLGEKLFGGCSSLTSFEIPLSVTEICKDAFKGASLTALTFEEGDIAKLRTVGRAFDGTKIAAFSFPETEEEILLAENIFGGIEGLTTLHISSKVYDLNDALRGCDGITAITVADGNPSYSVDENEIMLVGRNGDILYVFGELKGKISIPAGSAAVGVSAFAGTRIEEVFIPRSVMHIGDGAFKDCTSLVKVDFEEGSALTSIGREAFAGCSSLRSIAFNKTPQLRTLEENTFANCESLSALDLLGTKIGSIPAGVFDGCSSLTALYLPRTLTSIDATLGGTAVSVLDMAVTGVEELPANFFKGSTAFTRLVFPANLETIGESAFEGCTSLTAMDLSAGGQIVEIGEAAFKGCIRLAALTLAPTAKTIGYAAFEGCKALSVLDLQNVTSVAHRAFYASGLTEMKLPASAAEWGGSTTAGLGVSAEDAIFGACEELKTVTFSAGMTAETKLADYMFAGCTGLRNVVFESGCGIASIPKNFFADCTALQEIALPAGIAKIGQDAFAGCTALKKADLSAAAASDLVSIFAGCTGLSEVKLPNGLKTLANTVFRGMESLESITFPATLTKIPERCFEGCTKLGGTLNLPEGVEEISSEAFKGTAFSRATLPASIEKLGTGIFEENTGLEQVTVKSAPDGIPARMFYGCTALISATLPAAYDSIGRSAFENSALMVFTVPGGVTIDDRAFANCRLQSITVNGTSSGKEIFMGCASLLNVTFTAEDLTAIGQSWFEGCTELMTVDVPASVTELKERAFYGCEALKNFPLGQIKTIGQDALTGCDALLDAQDGWTDGVLALNGNLLKRDDARIEKADGTVTLPEGIETIPASFFKGCETLVKIVAPASLKTIGESAFEDCTALQEADLSKARLLKDLGASAFRGCTALTSAKLPTKEGTFQIGASAFEGCSVLEGIDLAGASKIKKFAFKGSGLKSVEIPKAITALFFNDLEEGCFQDCTALQTVTFAEGIDLRNIKTSLFKGCTALTSIEVPATVTRIYTGAFEGSGLREIVFLGNKTTTIDEGAFAGIGELTVRFVGSEEDVMASYGENYKNNFSANLPENTEVTFDYKKDA